MDLKLTYGVLVLSCIFCYVVFLHFGLVKSFNFNNLLFFSVAILQMILTGKNCRD
jgi:hypothetical protein